MVYYLVFIAWLVADEWYVVGFGVALVWQLSPGPFKPSVGGGGPLMDEWAKGPLSADNHTGTTSWPGT
jgi:hypothetical protein